MSSPQFQGFLKKKGKKRYFVLYNNVVYWFKNEQKTATFNHSEIKGCLELKGCSVAACKEKPINSFVISNLKDMNYYVLTAADKAQCDSWLEAVRAAIESTKQEVAEVEDIKRGVLVKKGKERLFVLKGDNLIWFLSKTGVEKKAKGSLPMAKAKVQRGSKATSFIISPRTGKPYELFAKSVAECDEWMAAVNSVLDRLEEKEQTSEGEKSGYLMKKGSKRWFIIKNGKLLWFNKLQSDVSTNANNYAILSTSTISSMPAQSGKYPFKLVTKKGNSTKEYILIASSERESNDWIEALVAAGATAAEGTKVTSPSSPTSSTPSLTSSTNGGGGGAGSDINPRASLQPRPPPGGVKLAGVSFVGEELPLNASAPPGAFTSEKDSGKKELTRSLSGKMNSSRIIQASDPLSAFNKALPDKKSGWLGKKGKKRWFVLENGTLSWYSQPKKHESGATPNGYLTIADCNVSSIGELHEGYAFAIYSRQEKGNEYILSASSAGEMEDWVLVLLKGGAIVEKEKERKGTVSGPGDADEDFSSHVDVRGSGGGSTTLRQKYDRAGWLEKKSKKRWFILKNGRLSWYKTDSDEGGAKEPAGFLELKQCFVRRIDGKKIKGKYAFLLFTEEGDKKREYILLHPNEVEVNEWVEALVGKGGAKRDTSASKPAGAMGTYIAPGSVAKGRIFGASLEEVLKREGRMDVGIPEIVEKCVAYIREFGMDVEGIFRVSGDTGVVNQLRELIEKSAESADASSPFNVKDDFEFDIHTISGILKLYLREMDPPLLTWELYKDFVEAAGRELAYLSELISRLPPCHQSFLRYLMFFLNEVASHADKSKMAPMNLSIVFAPNMFRSKGDPLEVLANSAQTATVCQAMIVHCKELWPGSSNVVEPKQIVVDNHKPSQDSAEPSRLSTPPNRPQPALPPGSRLSGGPHQPVIQVPPRPAGRPGSQHGTTPTTPITTTATPAPPTPAATTTTPSTQQPPTTTTTTTPPSPAPSGNNKPVPPPVGLRGSVPRGQVFNPSAAFGELQQGQQPQQGQPPQQPPQQPPPTGDKPPATTTTTTTTTTPTTSTPQDNSGAPQRGTWGRRVTNPDSAGSPGGGGAGRGFNIGRRNVN